VFQAHHDIPSLGSTISALADIEDELGHGQAAIALGHDALRLKYAAGDVNGIGVSHHNLAGYLDRHTPQQDLDAGGVVEQVCAHRIAATVIAYQTTSGTLGQMIRALARLLARADAPAPPAAFEQVYVLVGRAEGVDLALLVDRLPHQAPDGQTAMDTVLAGLEDLDTGLVEAVATGTIDTPFRSRLRVLGGCGGGVVQW
jgi:hypothetical protein